MIDRSLERVVVAVLDWNRYEMTRRCIASLAPLRDRGATILIVDNASEEPEAERLAVEFGEGYAALTLSHNGGSAGGYSAALRWADGAGASHLLMLNNDILMEDPRFGDQLIDAFDDRTAVVGPVVVGEDGAVSSAGSWIDWRRGRTRHRTDRPADDARPYPVEWVHGSCLMISLEAYRAIGPFDETYFMYWEDIDWCVRAWDAGWRCLIQPGATIVHAGTQTAESTLAARQVLRNSLFFMRKHGSTMDHAVFLTYYLLRRLPLYVLRRAWPAGRLRGAFDAAASALLWNTAQAQQRGSWRLPGARRRPLVR